MSNFSIDTNSLSTGFTTRGILLGCSRGWRVWGWSLYWPYSGNYLPYSLIFWQSWALLTTGLPTKTQFGIRLSRSFDNENWLIHLQHTFKLIEKKWASLVDWLQQQGVEVPNKQAINSVPHGTENSRRNLQVSTVMANRLQGPFGPAQVWGYTKSIDTYDNFIMMFKGLTEYRWRTTKKSNSQKRRIGPKKNQHGISFR